MICELVIVAASYHFHHGKQNEDNPGYGVNIVQPLNQDWDAYAGGARYVDSHSDPAGGALIGLRRSLGPYLGADVAAGYGVSHAYTGFTVIPSIYAGTRKVNVVVSLLGDRAIGFSVRVQL